MMPLTTNYRFSFGTAEVWWSADAVSRGIEAALECLGDTVIFADPSLCNRTGSIDYTRPVEGGVGYGRPFISEHSEELPE